VKTAVVTGADGFVGKAVLNELSVHHFKVYAVVREERKTLDEVSTLPGVQIIRCDMEHLDKLSTQIEVRPEVFIHLAWAGSSGEARADYDLQLQNVKWTVDAANAAHTLGCKRFLGVGSLAEFDVNAYTPLDGSTPNSVSIYGAAKIAAHYMSKAECSCLGMEHLWAYLSNVYGVGDHTNNFISFAAKTMIAGRPANFTSGEQAYDFVYVTDAAQGVRCVAEKGKKNCSYYIGSTKPAQLKEFIQIIRDEIDHNIQLNLGAIPFHGVVQPVKMYDCAKLIQDTGYHPKVPFEDGIRRTIKWIKEAEAT
jgi:nucleoside-diphosphate-sugar epimerase